MVDFKRLLRFGRRRSLATETGHRRLLINPDPLSVDATELPEFESNRVTNTKYTVLTFLPLNLKEQFGRFMNQYFLLIACLQLEPTLTPVSPVTTWAPLIFIFAVSAIKEALDDYARFKSDQTFNNRPYPVTRNGEDSVIKSEEIQVGDIIKIQENQEFPCDMVLLCSSEPDGTCYVQTANIDGETDLKTKNSIPQPLQPAHLHAFRGVIECPHPNRHIYSFDATLAIDGNDRLQSLDSKQLLLQGTFLKNTTFIYGAAVYTGFETKLGMNKHKPLPKMTKLDRMVDRMSRIIFLGQITLVLALGITGITLSNQIRDIYTYLDLNSEDTGVAKFFIIPLRMLLLMSFMIPISLKVTMDIVKYAAASFISWDLEMYDKETDEPAQASNTAIAEDLGQIEYIFTDKTGTLTENLMVFKQASLVGRIVDMDKSPTINGEQELNFWIALAVCQTVAVDDSDPRQIRYKGASPDEEALVAAAAKMGVVFSKKHADLITINVRGTIDRYRILHILEFSSDRRRMSVVVQKMSNTQIIIFSKGADDMMLPRCLNKDDVEKTRRHIEAFAHQGFRTLCIAMREFSPAQYTEWSEKLHRASTALQNRDQLIAGAYADVEQQMRLLGASSIEDRLQTAVPETIALLRSAGLKIWMLTGDKRATALQIAISCNLITDSPTALTVHLDGPDMLPAVMKQLIDHYHNAALQELQATRDQDRLPSSSKDVSVIVDGATLKNILGDQGCTKSFIDLCLMSRTVVCCRVTPHQKAEIVGLVKDRNFITLGIGDGGNDVAMIQRANIGVGIKGREGTQAARASDYSLARFKFLSRLILVHGRYSYNRTAFIAIYCYYKSMFLGFVQALYQFWCVFSGTSLLNTFSLSSYNIVFTAFPIIFFILDKDIDERSIVEYPYIYNESASGQSFTYRKFALWVVRAFYHSFIVVTFITGLLGDDWAFDGRSPGMVLMSMTVFSAGILIQTSTMLLESNNITMLNQIVIWGSLVLFIIVAALASLFLSSGMYMTMQELYAMPNYWMAIIVVTILANIPVFAFNFAKTAVNPSVSQVIKMKNNEEAARRQLLDAEMESLRKPIVYPDSESSEY